MDELAVSPYVASIVRGINRLSVTRNFGANAVPWPHDYTLYRGGGLPNEYTLFFSENKIYRVPMFLATSTDYAYCRDTFCSRAQNDSHLPPVIYVIYINPQFKCLHVNYVTRTNSGDEREFLFVPYSVFQVVRAEWQQQPTWQCPHIIYLNAMPDNKQFPEDLPLAPWH